MSIFDALGIDVKMLVAGFSGGAVREFFFGEGGNGWKTWRNWVASVVGGGLTAAYAGLPAAKVTGLSEPFCGFAVGAAAVFVAQGIISFAGGWAAKQRVQQPPDEKGA